MGNPTLINYPVSSDMTLSYDALNRVTNMVDAAGTTKYDYAVGGQLWTEDQPAPRLRHSRRAVEQ